MAKGGKGKPGGGNTDNSGDETYIGTSGSDEFYAGDGDDTLWGYDPVADPDGTDDVNDYLYGEGGNDIIYGGAGDDRIIGGAGTDTIYGGAGRDRIHADTDDILVDGGADGALIYFDSETEALNLSLADDGTLTVDFINSATEVTGSYINITDVWGTDYNDVITGNSDDNTLYGRDGEDTLNGGAGNDTLLGDAPNNSLSNGYVDVINGGDGNDFINGGAGDDILTGGAGADEFYLRIPVGGSGNDVIMDFTAGEDTLTISGWSSGNGRKTQVATYGDLSITEVDAIGNDGVADSLLVSYGNGGEASSVLLMGVMELSIDDVLFLQ